jgi:hypothetical protein
MANDGEIDYSGVTMDVSGAALVNALLPKIVTALVNNPTLLSQLTNAVTTKVLQKSRSTGSALGQYAGGSQTQAATSVNTNAIQR